MVPEGTMIYSKGRLWAVFCVLAVSMLFNAHSEDTRFTAINSTDGLSNSSVSSILQDSSGFLWLGTQGGLNRYDGYSFKIYENEPFDSNSLSHNQIQTMYMDRDDVIWIGTYGGLNRFDTKKQLFSSYAHDAKNEQSLSNNVVVSIYRDSRNTLWVGTLNGLNKFDEKTGSFTRYLNRPDDPTSLANNIVRSIIEDKKGRLWIATSGGGLDRYDYLSDAFIHMKTDKNREDSLPSDSVMSLALDFRGDLWVGCWFGGVGRMITEGVFENYKLQDDRIYTINVQDPEIVRVGTWGAGLFEIDRVKKTITSFKHDSLKTTSISHNIAYSILIDRGGEVWIGTNGGGVNHMQKPVSGYTLFQSDPQNPLTLTPGKVQIMLEDSKGRFWVGVYNGGLHLWNDKIQGFNHYRADPKNPKALGNDIITGLYEDSKGNIWILTNVGLHKYNEATNDFTRIVNDPENPNSLSENIVYSILEEKETGNFWLGTYTKGLEYWDVKANTFTHYSPDPGNPKALSDGLVYSLAYDKEGSLWIGTNYGLNVLKDNVFKRYLHNTNDKNSIASNVVRNLLIDSHNEIWVATNGGGLANYNRALDSFTNYTKREGMPSNMINTLVEDNDGNIWVGTANGLILFDRATRQPRPLTVHQDIRNREFYIGSFKNKQGALFFGSMDVLYKIEPDKIKYNDVVPSIKITGFKVFNEEKNLSTSIWLEKKVNINWDENYVSFDFAALDYRDSARNQYAYKLEGIDSDWVYCGSRTYTGYTNLPGGSYVFRVKGSNNDGVWNEVGASLILNVAAHPLLSPWAFIVYILLIVSLIYIVSNLRSTHLLKNKVEELTTVKSKLETANVKLAEIAAIDGLTGIANRRKLDEVYTRIFANSQRQKEPLAALMLDIDYFKRYNDQYGHQNGDDVLRLTASTIESSLDRAIDFCARYGGEEFLILLPNTKLEGAVAVAEKIRNSIEALHIIHRGTGAKELLTVSIGVSAYVPEPKEESETLIRKADEALYRAKSCGRNRVST